MRLIVEVWRGALVESRHRVSAAVVDPDGKLVEAAGDPGFVTYARSAVKPLQALPLVADGVVDAYGLIDAELALCCASHGGEPWQVAAAQSILAKSGVTEAALACGPHAPLHEASAEALRVSGVSPGRIHNNCSGKHAGMLALARFHGWPLEGYQAAEHPVQQRMLAEVTDWAAVPAAGVATAVDGCGVVTFAFPLHALARAFARLAAASGAGEGGPAARVVGAMRAHPEYVAGTGRLCTDLARATRGRVFAKVGAEGVYCAGVPSAGLGIALKVEDGARRAAEPALLGVLVALGFLSGAEQAALARYAQPEVGNTRGEVVGVVRAVAERQARRAAPR